jgi:hypothetical protein
MHLKKCIALHANRDRHGNTAQHSSGRVFTAQHNIKAQHSMVLLASSTLRISRDA